MLLLLIYEVLFVEYNVKDDSQHKSELQEVYVLVVHHIESEEVYYLSLCGTHEESTRTASEEGSYCSQEGIKAVVGSSVRFGHVDIRQI